MAYEHKDNTGSMFANDRKSGESDPDRKGSALIDGVEYWVNGWIKKSKNGKPYMSLSFKPKSGAAKPTARAEFNDSIGF
jgi:hypothetical protein